MSAPTRRPPRSARGLVAAEPAPIAVPPGFDALRFVPCSEYPDQISGWCCQPNKLKAKPSKSPSIGSPSPSSSPSGISSELKLRSSSSPLGAQILIGHRRAQPSRSAQFGVGHRPCVRVYMVNEYGYSLAGGTRASGLEPAGARAGVDKSGLGCSMPAS